MNSIISKTQNILTVSHLTKYFNTPQKPALKNISFTMNKGEVICLVGPSGSGKTTLLRCLNKLEANNSGEIRDNGLSMAFVSQDFNLWPHKTVLQNITLAPVLIYGMSVIQAEKEATKLLTKFGLLDKKDSYPEFLSGGQKQRVAIIRALAIKPQILLLDEITSSLDPELVSSVLNLIRILAKDGQSMIIATHHLKFASEVADRIFFLENGELIQQATTRDFIYAQNNERISEFIKTLGLGKQEINVYEGYDEFQAFQLGTLKRFKPGSAKCVVGSSGDRWFEAMGNSYEAYEKLRLEKKISWKMIMYNESPLDHNLRLRHPELNKYRLIPKDMKNPANYYVIEDVVVIQIFGQPGDAPVIIEIKNHNVAKSYKNYFNLLWERSSPIN